MSDGASVLAPNAMPTGIPGNPLPDSISAPGATDVLSGGQQPPQVQPQPVQPQATPSDQQIPTQDSPDYRDPDREYHAAHGQLVHHLLSAAHAISNTLGGSETYKVTSDANGMPQISKTDSTEGEKWGRIALGILGGAAKGFAAGQGPGGAARAVGAGFDQGVQQRQQQQQMAEHNLTVEQKRMQDNANFVLTQQKFVGQTLANKAAGMALSKEEQDQSNDEQDRYENSPNSTPVGEFGSVHEAATSPNTALILKAHPNGTLRTATAFDKDGKITGVHAYVVDRDWADRRNDAPVPYLEQVASDDPNAEPKFEQRFVPANGDKNSKVDTFVTAKNLAAAKIRADWATLQAKLHPVPKTLPEMQLRLQTATDPGERAALQSAINATQNTPEARATVAEKMAQTGAANAEADIRRENLSILKGGAGGGGSAAQGKTGEEYLQASGIDPASWNRIRATAAGELKPPTQSRSPANAAFLNAVQNYDPTYTQARYDTIQNFKTKGDSDSIKQLSTAMAHADRALRNSKILGDSPSLATGVNLSGPAATYNEDVNFFTGEQGKLVMGGVLGEHEAERLRHDISSPIQSIREPALREALRLTSGKVGAIFQKFKTGTGMEIPVEKYFDQPTQQLLSRHHIANAPPPKPQHSIATAMGLPANQGKTKAEVTQDLINHGYDPIP